MMLAAATHGPSALWYATRGTGAVALVLLTASVVLGISEVRAWQPLGSPRFAVASLHRSLSLLAVALLAVHIVTTLLDPFPRIAVAAAVIPFTTSYRPLWVGLGAIAADLLLALVVTSLVRRHLGYRTWRGVHWFAYACWPIALLHGLGTGSDARTTWMQALTVGCVAAVLAALAGRLAAPRVSARARMLVATTAVVAVLVASLWANQGPLAKGWARRAGTPSSVLNAFAPHRVLAPGPPTTAPARAASIPSSPFSARVAGVVKTGTSAGGTAVVDLNLHLDHGHDRLLHIRLGGQPIDDGGVQLTRSAVRLGSLSDPSRFAGRVAALDGGRIRSLVGDTAGRALRLDVGLALHGHDVSGLVRVTPVKGGP